MSRFARQCRAAQAVIDHAYENEAEDRAEEARERDAEAADALTAERMADSAKVAAEIDELLGSSQWNSDGNTHKAADMAAVLLSSPAAYEAETVRFFNRLREQVESVIRAEIKSENAA